MSAGSGRDPGRGLDAVGEPGTHPVQAVGQVVVPCTDLDASLAFFTGRLGFRLNAIFPADAPRVAEVSGCGLRLRLERDAAVAPVTLRLATAGAVGPSPRELVDPAGNRVLLLDAQAPPELPPGTARFALTRADESAVWSTGRAGMRYRDLAPDRQGGRVIASLIRIDAGGPVADYVHHHAVLFQLIHCRRGEVRVVYEDQGPPFWLRAGDAVLQPPHIRHRVLECSPGVEVIEVGCPAEHATLVDHELELPTPYLCPDRTFGGQRFVRHEAARARWGPWRSAGFECRDLGVEAATEGLAAACVARPAGAAHATSLRAHGRDVFLFVLAGSVQLERAGCATVELGPGDALIVPAGLAHAFLRPSRDLELLDVALPGAAGR